MSVDDLESAEDIQIEGNSLVKVQQTCPAQAQAGPEASYPSAPETAAEWSSNRHNPCYPFVAPFGALIGDESRSSEDLNEFC